MKRFRFTFCAALALVLTTAIFSYPQETPRALAQKASEHWLALVDAGKYGESWDAAARAFKDALSRQAWINQVEAARKPLGKLVSRKLAKSNYMKNPPGAPPGEYVAIEYQSSFENLKSATETVVPTLDKDGKWRVSGYFVKKTP